MCDMNTWYRVVVYSSCPEAKEVVFSKIEEVFQEQKGAEVLIISGNLVNSIKAIKHILTVYEQELLSQSDKKNIN